VGPSAACFGLPISDHLTRPLMLIMLIVTLLLLPQMLKGSRIGRRQGLGLLLIYAAFFLFNAGLELHWFALPAWARWG